MSRLLTHLLLAFVLALHSAEAVRYGLMNFNLAPNCPVLGDAGRLSKEPAPATECPMSNHIASTQTTPAKTDSEPKDKDTNPSENCQTCELLAVLRRIGVFVFWF